MVGLWDSVTGFFSDLGDFFSGKDFFETAGYAWNDMMKLAADVLTEKSIFRHLQRCLGKYINDLYHLKRSCSFIALHFFLVWILQG